MPTTKLEKWMLEGEAKGEKPPKLRKWPPSLPGFSKRAFARHHEGTETARRPPGRPLGSRNAKTGKKRGGRPGNKGGRPSTLHDRPDCPAKLILEALGGVRAAQKHLVLAGLPYTRVALYKWLERGYIPDRPLAAILTLGQVAHPGAPPFPSWVVEWNSAWLPAGLTPPRPPAAGPPGPIPEDRPRALPTSTPTAPAHRTREDL